MQLTPGCRIPLLLSLLLYVCQIIYVQFQMQALLRVYELNREGSVS